MTGVGERFGRWDDRSAREDHSFGWWLGLYLVVGAATSIVIAVLAKAIGAAAYVVVGALALLWVVGYVVWRRRRNQRLTGSPTTWPS